MKVCYHDDRYSIEVQIPSLFERQYRLLGQNCEWFVDKYVTESMPTAKEEDIASGTPIAKARPRQTPTVTLTSISIPVLERIWIDIETQRSNDQKCFEVSNYDMIKQSLKELTEQSSTMTSWNSARGRSSTTLRNGYLKIGCQLWQKEEELRKDFNIA